MNERPGGDDVRNVGRRIAIGIACIASGVGGAIGGLALAELLMHHPPPDLGGRGTGQGGFFAAASIVFGFILGGAIGGITIEAIRRVMHRRRRHRALPRMIVRRPTT